MDTQIILLNDVKSNVDFEVFYNDITEGVTIEKKNLTRFTLLTKMIFTTNKTIKIEGGSAEDRCFEFEFSPHYSKLYSPEDEFGHRFFTEWDKEQWKYFDNLMMICICLYKEKGLIPCENINLNKRKLVDETNPDFIDFLDEKIKTGVILPGVEINKKILHDIFLSECPEFFENKQTKQFAAFTKWIKKYVKYDSRFDEETRERKSGKDRFITLFLKGLAIKKQIDN